MNPNEEFGRDFEDGDEDLGAYAPDEEGQPVEQTQTDASGRQGDLDYEALAMDRDIAELREHSMAAHRFLTDDEYAFRTMEQRAGQFGFALVPRDASESHLPPNILRAVKQGLPEELKWMAPTMAQSILAAAGEMMPRQPPAKPKPPPRHAPLAKDARLRDAQAEASSRGIRTRTGETTTPRESLQEAFKAALQSTRRGRR